jgi:hypothetical protein
MRNGWIGLLTVGLVAGAANAAVFQYAIPIPTGKGETRAFLWVPAEAPQIRGVILGGMTLMEREFAKDAQIRKACAEEQLAIGFLKCGLAGPDLQKILADFAKVSGYAELPFAPLMFVGHSAGGPAAKQCATRMADRCFGLVQYRGGGPWGGEAVPPGVPALMMVGQFDEFGGAMRDEDGREGAWQGACVELAKHRTTNEANLASIVVEPGAGHFAWSDRNAAYLALYIRKAARARIPDWRPDAKEPVTCKAVDPKSGWLTDLAIRSKGEFDPAAYAAYKGEKGAANWHFDRELAEATVAYHAGMSGKKDQFIKWSDPYWVDAGTRYFFTSPKWVGDGVTLEVHPVYNDIYPGPQPNGGGPRWADAGKPVGNSGAPILVKSVSGPLVPTGANTLRLQCDNLAPATEGARATFMAYSGGDAEYRHTEHVGMLPRGFNGFNAGKEQTIAFPPIGDLKAGGAQVELKATSDSGLPVQYYVAYGPAEVKDGKLAIAELPARATLPVEVGVVAYQFGSGMAPQVRTAKPVEQAIRIVK